MAVLLIIMMMTTIINSALLKDRKKKVLQTWLSAKIIHDPGFPPLPVA